jgi:alpha-tubulin suppressor-like RCC1 family protein
VAALDIVNELLCEYERQSLNDENNSWACCCRPEHSGAVTADGRVYTWGGGWCGCLGHVNEENELLPREVEGLRGTLAVQIKVGKRKTFVVSDLGKVRKGPERNQQHLKPP